MKRLFHILTLAVSLFVCCQMSIHAANIGKSPITPKELSGLNERERKDTLHGFEKSEEKATAIIENTAETYRVCSSRPQRILPSCEPNFGHFIAQNARSYHATIIAYRQSSHLKQSAPIRKGSSIRYYVYALRHIIC